MEYSWERDSMANISDLKGKTLTSIDYGTDELVFNTDDGKQYLMTHIHD